jgi:hypothetical protein
VFKKVSTKLERAEYFLDQIQSIAIGTQPWRACLEAFFFELISAKDFFLQELNDKYALGLERDEATRIELIKRCLSCKRYSPELEVIRSIEKEMSNQNSWFWKLNNYRNSATHRELLSLGYEASTDFDHVHAYLFEDPEDISKGNMRTEVIPYCEQSLDAVKNYFEGLYSKLSCAGENNLKKEV